MMFRALFPSWINRWVAVGGVSLVLLLASGWAVATASAQTAVPLIFVTSVVRNQTATISTRNFPAEQTFTVIMGEYGSRGIDGYMVNTINSEDGSPQKYTFNIPAALQNHSRIAIRLQSEQGYYSFNWFYNNTATVACPQC